MSLFAGAERIASWSGAQGELEIYRLRAHVVCLRMIGNVEQPAAKVIESTLAAAFKGGKRLQTFWELGELVSYHSDVRIYSTNVLLANRSQLESLHTYSTSKVVAMGIAVANLALGGIITAHKTRDSFDQALRRAIEK
jgi:hypothetical protein